MSQNERVPCLVNPKSTENFIRYALGILLLLVAINAFGGSALVAAILILLLPWHLPKYRSQAFLLWLPMIVQSGQIDSEIKIFYEQKTMV